jgi:hypothetical protein
MRPSNLISKMLSVMSILILICNMVFSGYIVSLHKGQINNKNFTISQALAFGNEIALVVLIVVSLLLFGYLIYYRKQSKISTLIRLFLLLVAGIFLITIVWITTFRHEQQHYIFASIIFICNIIFITLNSFVLWTEKDNKKLYEKIIILIIPILTYVSLIGLLVGLILKKKDIAHEVFPSFENITFALLGGSILSIGFI